VKGSLGKGPEGEGRMGGASALVGVAEDAQPMKTKVDVKIIY
jgi:hypothetical protein